MRGSETEKRTVRGTVRPANGPEKPPAEQVIKDIRRAARRHFSAEDKIRIVLEGLRGEDGCSRKDARASPG